MLESALDAARAPPTAPLDARRLGLPVWTIKTVERFLNDIGAKYKAAKNGIGAGAVRLRGSFLKFESIDGKNRTVARELAEWPRLDLSGRHRGPPFARSDGKVDDREADGRCEGVGAADLAEPRNLRSRMTRKTRPRPKERADVGPKRGGYCEICRASYSTLSEHERAASHVNFVKNCSNFLSLDSLINEGADVETFLKMNRSVSNACERRSLRNVIKVHQESESFRRQLRIVCDGTGDDSYRQSPKRGNGTLSPGETGHYLRSKGIVESDVSQKSPRDCRKELRNGDLSPRRETESRYAKINGYAPRPRGRPPGPRWRRPSPETDTPPEDRTYYKVVGVSAKLRSGAGCDSVAPKDLPPPPPPVESRCNGTADASLVVKFRRVRRSELSVLSDEAENFMFPKKDDSDTTEDEDESTNVSESRSAVKEEAVSGDEASSDSCESNKTRKRGRRKRSEADGALDVRVSKRRNLDSLSDSLEESKENLPRAEGESTPCRPAVEKCLKWEDGRLKTSPEVENLTFAFEHVPKHEPWYDAYNRQDSGKINSHDVARYLGYYWKSPILPYEMGQLPPLKPDCCPLSRLKRGSEPKPGPSRLYGTRGTKKKKIKKEETLVLGKKPRKSPREHASTLAILGGLVHKRRSKFSGSEDTKSLPSIAEEDVSVASFKIKLPEIPVPESSKKLEEFFSSLVDDDEYDTLVDHLDATFRAEEAEIRPDFTEVVQNYEECEAIENAAREMQTAARLSDGRRRRRGHKFKKKNNRTGWPAKKRVQAKKDLTSALSSREASVDGDALQETGSEAVAPYDTSAEAVENCVALENVENSITSNSDVEDSEKTEGEDRTAPGTENGSDRTEKSFHRSARDSKDLQPVVRVQKMETRVVGSGRRRRLRSSGARRKPRIDQNR